MARTVAGIFVDHEQAINAVGALRNAGFEMSQIGLVARDSRLGWSRATTERMTNESR